MNEVIASASTIGGAHLCIAVFTGDSLLVHTWKKLKGKTFSENREKIEEEIKEKFDTSPVSVIIEDPLGQINLNGTRLNLEDSDPSTGRAFLNIALDRYFDLVQMGNKTQVSYGAISIHKKAGTSVNKLIATDSAVSASAMNISYDDKGRRRYEFVKGLPTEMRVILLAILRAMVLKPMSSRSAEMMVDALNISDDEDDIPSTLRSIMGEDYE